MDDLQLREMETFAKDLSRRAGGILLEHFQKPIGVEYKSKDQTNPVTDADKRSEEFLKEAILKEYPTHGLLAEEGSQVESQSSDFTWVIDPLDGTVNFLNGLPIFAVSVGVLYKGEPVVGCIHIPSHHGPQGSVFHARKGGGAYRDDEAITVSQGLSPKKGRITVFPAFWVRTFRMKRELRSRLGEIRSLGSVAYELAMTASGVIQYSFFGSPWIWDVAAGIVLVKEAQGMALSRRRNVQNAEWKSFQDFSGPEGNGLGPEELKEWRSAWVFGGPQIAEYVTTRMESRSRLELKVSRWLGRWFW
jgi:myo-inositol-1(or 4)-monophosphatase